MARVNKVTVGKAYTYQPVMIDRIDPKTVLRPGMVVEVVEKRGCPPANTMGHCFVSLSGTFQGLVHCNSLVARN